MAAAARDLIARGFAVVEYPGSMQDLQAEFDDTVNSLPELSAAGVSPTTGEFGAINTPSSQHNPFVRKVRAEAFKHMRPILEEVATRLGYRNVEVLIDRMCVRRAGTCVQGETVHRDEAHGSGVCFGGWLCIGSDQYFTCAPGSHGNGAGRGFAPIQNPSAYKDALQTIVVPEGFMVIFFEDIVHAIARSTCRTRVLRLFLAYRVSNETKPLVAKSREHLVDMLARQDLVPIKSGQVPPMYPALYWVNHRAKLEKFSKNFKAVCRHRRTVKSGVHKGKTYDIVKRHLGSLEDLGALYSPYQPEEIEILLPSPIHCVARATLSKKGPSPRGVEPRPLDI